MRFIKIGLLVCVAIAVLLYGFMWLWNWLMPDVFGFSTINIWQTAGLLLMSRILFGSWGNKHHYQNNNPKKNWLPKMKNRWQSMTPEEKEKFKDRWGWCSDMDEKEVQN
ncbi:MAG: hypothetical protein RIA69_04420 [Cyclobacteriaceae bacterium]